MGEHNFLFLHQRVRCIGDEYLVMKRIAFHADFGAVDDALLHQNMHDLRGAGEFLAQLAECRRPLVGVEDLDDARLDGCRFAQFIHFGFIRHPCEGEMTVGEK